MQSQAGTAAPRAPSLSGTTRPPKAVGSQERGQSRPAFGRNRALPEESYPDYRHAETVVNRHPENFSGKDEKVHVHPKFDTFGQRLEYWRTIRGYKRQGALAEQIGIKQSSLSELESGETKKPSADVLLRLCDTLHLRPKYLLNGDGPAESQYFQELNGLEAQLVMIFRQLPTDAARDALLIDANDLLNRANGSKATTANPFPTAPPVPTKKKAAAK